MHVVPLPTEKQPRALRAKGHRRICCLSHSGVVSDGKGEGGGVLRGVAVRLVEGWEWSCGAGGWLECMGWE